MPMDPGSRTSLPGGGLGRTHGTVAVNERNPNAAAGSRWQTDVRFDSGDRMCPDTVASLITAASFLWSKTCSHSKTGPGKRSQIAGGEGVRPTAIPRHPKPSRKH